MHLIPPVGLLVQQIQRLDSSTEEQRVEFEELAAHFEFEGTENRHHAERHAYCVIQWKYRWAESNYPDFSLKGNEQKRKMV